ncbi:serine hydrolase domain-containing protein [Nocardia iowensis]|uniref:Beta-lactamase family protein n=3 Tax=Nocardia iowensis TaxID=204891 RepID=A0ABX8RLS0_NOCIO|nr:serine hydrolase [Nocardia iowensis]QXN90251.1 beta-lactamase family protein [Nocardia iowensis]
MSRKFPKPPTPCMEVTNGNWQKSVGSWSYQNMDKILSTEPIPRIHDDSDVASLPDADWVDRDEILDLEVTLKNNERYTVRKIIDATDTDGWIVLRDNKVVIEQYFGTMAEDTRHILMSVTKPLTATVAGILMEQEKMTTRGEYMLEPDKKVNDYVPELGGPNSGYKGATVQTVLDMRSAVKFSEDYLDPTSEVREMDGASGWAPRPSDQSPTAVKQFLSNMKLASDPKRIPGCFEYRSCETYVIGWVCEAAYKIARGTDMSFAQIASQLLWSKLGAQHDAYITVDEEDTGGFDGGICATLRDLARYGAMICGGGKSLRGHRVVSQRWVDDVFKGGDAQAFADGPRYNELDMPGGKFHNMFWSPSSDRNVVIGIGIHGQMLYINKATGTVGVKLSSWALPEEAWKGGWKGFSALSIFQEIDTHLTRSAASKISAGVAGR